jgi:hypothetical protein
VKEREARMTVAVVKFDAEAEPRLALTVYKSATDQTAGELVLDLMTRQSRSSAGAPVNGRNQKHLQ